ncbi:MAG: MrtP family glutamic-type intramembrane protease [bacterium]
MSESPRRDRWRELLLLYGLTLLASGGLTALQGSIGWIRGYLTTIVAGLFIFLPLEILQRRGEDPAALGIHGRQLGRALKCFLLVSAVVFPPYLLTFHGWQTTWLEHRLEPERARFDRWPTALQDAPRLAQPAEGDVWLHTEENRLWIQWRLPAGQRLAVDVTTPGPHVVQGSHLIQAQRPDGVRLAGGSDGRVAVDVPGATLKVAVEAGGDALPPGRLRLGTALVAASDVPYTAERSWWWLIELILVQLLLVALPEELFYRGYLQSRLDGLVGRDRRVLGVQVNLHSLVLTSALFAIGHIVTIPHPARLAVFFPSLLFGWMRRATGGIAAPIAFHAACNLLVDVVGRFYFG